MAAPIGSTGSAGLIQTVQQYVKHSWVAAVLGTVATAGWVIQGLGNAFYYRQVSAETAFLSGHDPDGTIRSMPIILLRVTQWKR